MADTLSASRQLKLMFETAVSAAAASAAAAAEAVAACSSRRVYENDETYADAAPRVTVKREASTCIAAANTLAMRKRSFHRTTFQPPPAPQKQSRAWATGRQVVAEAVEEEAERRGWWRRHGWRHGGRRCIAHSDCSHAKNTEYEPWAACTHGIRYLYLIPYLPRTCTPPSPRPRIL